MIFFNSVATSIACFSLSNWQGPAIKVNGLLLEIDNNPVIVQRLQSKVLELKKFFKDKNIKIRNFSIKDQSIFFDVNVIKKEEVLSLLDDDKSEINTYFQQFKSHEFDIENEDNSFKLTYSDYGLVLLKNSSLDQAIETVRRRVDEVGTNEPNTVSYTHLRAHETP